MSFICGCYIKQKDVNVLEETMKLLSSYSPLQYDKSGFFEVKYKKTAQAFIMAKYSKVIKDAFFFIRDEQDNTYASYGYNSYLANTDTTNVIGIFNPKDLVCGEGDYCSSILSNSGHQLTLFNDRFGSRPLYYFENNRGYFFSSNFNSLLPLLNQKNLNYIGWLQLYLFGKFAGTNTSMESIKRLSPASIAIIGPDGIQIDNYWKPSFNIRYDLSPSNYAEQVYNAFRNGTILRTKDCTGSLALSGGVDSRLIASIISPDKFDAFTFTFANNKSDFELECAKEIALSSGFTHNTLNIPNDLISATATEMIRLNGGMISILHVSKVMQMIQMLTKLNITFLVGGAPADGLAGSVIPSIDYIRFRKTEVDFFKSIQNIPIEILYRIFHREFINAFAEQALQEMMILITNNTGPTTAHSIISWALAVHEPGFGYNSPIHSHPYLFETYPHNGYEYTDLMLQLPQEWLFKKNFYKYMVYQMIPEYRTIPYSNTGQILSSKLQEYTTDYSHTFIENMLIFRSFISLQKRKIKNIIRKPTIKMNNVNPQQLAMISDTNFLFTIKDVILNSPILNDIINKDNVITLLEDFKNGIPICPRIRYDIEVIGSLGSLCYFVRELESSQLLNTL